MKYRWESLPIVIKLFLALFGGITLVIIILLSYVWGYESNLMLKKEQDLLYVHSISVANDLNGHLSALNKELLFLSRLEVMNDMVTGDMDRRITTILEQKSDDLGESITLLTLSLDGSILASSDLTQINTNFQEVSLLKNAIDNGKSSLFSKERLYFFAPIHGTFYTQDILGYLVMSYPLKNFSLHLKSDQNLHRWLSPPASLSNVYNNTLPTFNPDSYLSNSILLGGILKGWSLHYAMPKKDALELLYHIQTLFLSAFSIGLTVIAFLVWSIVLQIVKPLRSLSDTAKKIAATGDYTQRVAETGNDEVGMMAHSFNALMTTTRLSIDRIELLGKTQAALQSKSSFLSAMSHELRTPLGSILSLTQYLMTQAQTPEPMIETLGKIENSAHYLLGVINNVLDLAKAESGKIKPHIAQCDPISIVENALDLVTPLAEDKGLQIMTRFEPSDEVLMSDARLLGQVVINLLSNAIKYTQKGSIDVAFHVDDGLFTLVINDSGCGIAHDELAHLFDEFYQVRSKNESGLEGSGLGLAISQHIAVLLHGDLSITSKGEGRGTTATFRFRTF
jgi:signal transduction histidine kinase